MLSSIGGNYTLTPAKAVRYRPQWFSRRHYEFLPVDQSADDNALGGRRTNPRRAVAPSLSTVIQDANKEGTLKLMWGEGTLGGTKGAAKFETMMNKMFGTNIKIGFTPGAAMPQMGSQIAAEYAAGQSAASDVYIGADSYLAPLVKHKLFH